MSGINPVTQTDPSSAAQLTATPPGSPRITSAQGQASLDLSPLTLRPEIEPPRSETQAARPPSLPRLQSRTSWSSADATARAAQPRMLLRRRSDGDLISESQHALPDTARDTSEGSPLTDILAQCDRALAAAAPNLNVLYGPSRPANPKGKASAIYASELSASDGRTAIVHPQRVVLSRGPVTPGQRRQIDTLHRAVQNGTRAKRVIAPNGHLAMGPEKVFDDDGREVKLGHVTLVGGTDRPHGRIGGEILRLPASLGNTPACYITNDSGRFSKFADLNPTHLEAVAKRFAQMGFPVETRWIDLASKPKKGAPKTDVQDNPPAAPSGL